MADMLLNPSSLLLPESERLDPLSRKPFTHVGDDYDDFVRSTVHAKLQQIYLLRGLARYLGRPLIGGGFAVGKDEFEDRFISDLPVNQLFNPAKLPSRA